MKAIQVTWELGKNNREREIKGLVRACKFLKLGNGTIITYDQEEILKEDKIIVNVIPYWKWIVKKGL